MERPTVDQIESFMARHGLSQTTTAQRSGISPSTLARYRKQGTDNADPRRVARLRRFMTKLDRRQETRGWMSRLIQARYR